MDIPYRAILSGDIPSRDLQYYLGNITLRHNVIFRYGAYQVMKKKFAKEKEAKQANLRQRMRDLKKVNV
jgi:hypothetical protein